MKTYLYFVRHGETVGNKARIFQGQSDTPLNDVGRDQILETCKEMVKLHIQYNVIYSSPLSRAVESAEIIQSFFPSSKQINIEPLAIERCFGAAEGITINAHNYSRIMRNEFEGEESELEITDRAQKLIKRILNDHQGKRILIVSHSHFIKACLITYLKSIRFDTKTTNGGISLLVFNEFNHCIKAEIDINKKDL